MNHELAKASSARGRLEISGTPLGVVPLDPGSTPGGTEPDRFGRFFPGAVFTPVPSPGIPGDGDAGSDRVRDGGAGDPTSNPFWLFSPASRSPPPSVPPPLEDRRPNQLPTPDPNDDAADLTLWNDDVLPTDRASSKSSSSVSKSDDADAPGVSSPLRRSSSSPVGCSGTPPPPSRARRRATRTAASSSRRGRCRAPPRLPPRPASRSALATAGPRRATRRSFPRGTHRRTGPTRGSSRSPASPSASPRRVGGPRCRSR